MISKTTKVVKGLRFDHSIIGGYDVRARGLEKKGAAPNLTPEVAYHFGLALGSRLPIGSTVFVARDGRISSPAIMESLINGYRDTGINVDANQDVTPTGIATWRTIQKKYSGSAVVSGSHNPYEDNGIKITEHGEALYGERLKELVPMIENGQYRIAEERGRLRLIDCRAEYYQMLNEQYTPLNTRRNIIFDAGNGIGGGFLPTLEKKIEQAGGKVEGINLVADGLFPAYGSADPSKPSCVDPVAKMVIEDNVRIIAEAKGLSAEKAGELLSKVEQLDRDLQEQLTIALILDGDADRCGFIDETGSVVWPEKMAAIFYLQYLRNLKAGLLPDSNGNFMALDVRASTSTTEMVRSYGGNGWFIQAGYPAHREWAKSIIPEIGKDTITGTSAEASGHFFFPTAYYGTEGRTYKDAAASLVDDGIYSALNFLTFLDAQSGFSTLHALMKLVPSKPASREIRIDVDNSRKYEIVEALKEMVRIQYESELLPLGQGVIKHGGLYIQAPNEGLILVDGVRPQFADGSFFLGRASNTSAKLTSIAEARTITLLIHRLGQLQALIETFGSSANASGIAEEIRFLQSLEHRS